MRKFYLKLLKRKDWEVLFFLSLLSFFESLILPIPVDIFALGLSSWKPKKWFFFFSFATFFSVVGGITAYFLGYFYRDFVLSLVHFFNYEKLFFQTGEMFQKSSFFVLFISAFTPIPYKVFTLSAGFFHVSLFSFISASFLGRGLRFFLESYFGMKFGEVLAKKKMKKINIISLLLVLVFILFLILFSKFH